MSQITQHSDAKTPKPKAFAPSEKLISLVIPIYNEERNIPVLVREIVKNANALPYEFEFVLVDDGSADNSVDVIQRYAAREKRIRLVQLARNFGKESAVSAGLGEAKGDAVIIMDADLQMPPALIGEFLQKWEQGGEVVVGVFAERNMSRIRAMGARTFYSLMQRMGQTKITPNATDFRLLDREVVDIFNSFTERNRITRGLIDWMGFQRDYIYFKQAPRQHGEPTYSFKKLIELAMNSFTAFSFFPLKFAGYIGTFILVISVPLGITMYVERYVLDSPLHWQINGTSMLAVLNLFLVGVTLACMGLISLYIARIHAEVTNRPLYIVRRKPTVEYSESDILAIEQEAGEHQNSRHKKAKGFVGESEAA